MSPFLSPFLLHQNRREAALKQMSHPRMPPINPCVYRPFSRRMPSDRFGHSHRQSTSSRHVVSILSLSLRFC